MSVEIFDAEGESRISIPVASERMFCSVWEPALEELGIDRLGNGLWLERDELDLILQDFLRVKEWAEQRLTEKEAGYVTGHIDFILEELPARRGRYPRVARLWMG